MYINQNWISQLPINNIKSVKPVTGGYMNKAYCIKTPAKKYFMKVQPNQGKRFFKYEVDGIKLVSKATLVPKIISYGQIGDDGYLIYAWDNFIDFNHGNQYKLGQAVAKVHLIHNDRFGFNYSFHLGRIPKDNTWQTNWIKFYLNQRLDVSVRILRDDGVWNNRRAQHYQRLRADVIKYYSQHKVQPSLLHGDLWSGNCGFLTDGRPILYDPNVIYGDRELDLALTTLKSSIANFNQDFYRGYNSIYPVRPGFKKRRWWYQLNYVFNDDIIFHRNSGIDEILDKF